MRAVFRGAWIAGLGLALSACQAFDDGKDGRALAGEWPYVHEVQGLQTNNGGPRTARSIYEEVAGLATAAGRADIADAARQRYMFRISWTTDPHRTASYQYSYAQAIVTLRLAQQGHWDNDSKPMGVMQVLAQGGPFDQEFAEDWGDKAYHFPSTADFYLQLIADHACEGPPDGPGAAWCDATRALIDEKHELPDSPNMGTPGDPWNAIRYGYVVSAYYAAVAREWDDCHNELEHFD